MVNYSNGKIYKIISNHTDLIYIGSTTQTLAQRKQKHRNKNNCSSIEILQYDDARIILIELFSCNCKEELTAREQYYMDKFRADGFNLVNNNRAIGRDIERKRKKTNEWTKRNKEVRKEYMKNYGKINKKNQQERIYEFNFMNRPTRVLEVCKFIEMLNQY